MQHLTKYIGKVLSKITESSHALVALLILVAAIFGIKTEPQYGLAFLTIGIIGIPLNFLADYTSKERKKIKQLENKKRTHETKRKIKKPIE